MELQFQSFHVLFAFLFFVFIVVKIRKRSIAKNSAPKLPPGPRKLPLIGNMHQLGGSLLHHTLRDFAMKYGPLMHLKLGEVSTIVVSSPKIAKEVMKTHDIIFSQRPNFLVPKILSYDCTNIVFAPYGDYWRQLRKICTVELFSSKCVQLFRSVREEEVSNLIRTISLHGRSPINLSKIFFSLLDDIISRAAFGKKCKDKDAFISVVTTAIAYLGGFPIAEMYPSIKWLPLISGIKGKLEKVQREADRLLENILNDHKEKETTTKTIKGEADEDLVDVLLKFQKNGDLKFPLSDNSIKAVILDIFIAGSETSATTAAWAMSEMLKNPRVMKKAQAEVRQVFDGIGNVDETGIHELKFLKSVIKETLRLHPAGPLLLPRESRERCEINGYEIPAQTRVFVNAWAIGRDSKYWVEAERFYPERFLDVSIDYKGNDFEFIPFGAGRRICPGISFAVANIELLLAQMLYHFNWELPNGMKQEDLDMTEALGLVVRKKEDLYLIPIPYHPSPLE